MGWLIDLVNWFNTATAENWEPPRLHPLHWLLAVVLFVIVVALFIVPMWLTPN